jgi:predicted O-methyltransferase YrrM
MIKSGIPWWPYKAAEYLDSYLSKLNKKNVFEWGSGASTIWLASKADSVTSIEHNSGWHSLLSESKPINVTVKLIEPSKSKTPKIASSKKGFFNLDFDSYVTSIRLSDRKFDLIVVDGRARLDCIEESAKHLKAGGIIFLDNSQRHRYSKAKQILGPEFEAVRFFGLTPASPIPTFSTAFVNKPDTSIT